MNLRRGLTVAKCTVKFHLNSGGDEADIIWGNIEDRRVEESGGG